MPAFKLPNDLCPAELEFGLQDNTVLASSALVGGSRTYQRPGINKWLANLGFRNVRDEVADSFPKRRAMQALAAAMRGKGNRIYLTDLTRSFGGSFPLGELLLNGDFRSGVTGWTAGGDAAIAADSGSLRMTRIQTTGFNNFYLYQLASGLTAGAVYVGRCMWTLGRGPANQCGIGIQESGATVANDLRTVPTLTEVAYVAGGTSLAAILDLRNDYYPYLPTTGYSVPGDYIRVLYMSLARGAMVDAGYNSLLWSDDVANAAWTKTNFASNAKTLSYDGSNLATVLAENTANAPRFVTQSFNLGSTAATDLYVGAIVAPGTGRGWCYLQVILPNSSSHAVKVSFNLGTGAIGTQVIDANFSGCTPYIQSMGSGFYLVGFRTRKTNADTAIQVNLAPITADNGTQYAGSASNPAITVARIMAGVSTGITSLGGMTTTVARDATSLPGFTGNRLDIGGLPPSIAGLGIAGDRITVHGEYKELTENLNSDALGRGVLCFEPEIRVLCPDRAAIGFTNPMCRFRFNDETLKWTNRRVGPTAGEFDSDLDLALIEAWT